MIMDVGVLHILSIILRYFYKLLVFTVSFIVYVSVHIILFLFHLTELYSRAVTLWCVSLTTERMSGGLHQTWFQSDPTDSLMAPPT